MYDSLQSSFVSNPRESILTPYASERLETVARITVFHPDFKAAANAVDRCIKSHHSPGETICIRVQAEAGCGKSHLANRSIWRYPEYRQNGQLIKPVMRVRVPPKPTIKGLAAAMLEEYHDPYANRWSSEQEISAHLDFRIEQCETKIIFVEEVNHFVETKSAKLNTEAANWFKIRLESTRVSFVASGLPWMSRLFDQDEQLKGRFDGPFVLNCFIWFTHEADPEIANKPFRSFMHKIYKKFPFKDCIDFGEYDIALRFFIISKGVPREIGKLLKQAALLAEEEDTETIGLDILRRAYKLRVGERITDAENPFSLDYDLAEAEESLRLNAATPATKK